MGRPRDGVTATANLADLRYPPLCILVCMARLNVYVPDDLAERARAHGLNVSALTQAAIAAELERTSTTAWLKSLPAVEHRVSHAEVIDALDAARDEFGAS